MSDYGMNRTSRKWSLTLGAEDERRIRIFRSSFRMLGGFFAFFRGLCRNCAQDINVILFHQNFGHSDVQQLEDKYLSSIS